MRAGAASHAEDSRGASELTKAAAAASAPADSSDHSALSQPATPSTPAPTGAHISASSYSFNSTDALSLFFSIVFPSRKETPDPQML